MLIYNLNNKHAVTKDMLLYKLNNRYRTLNKETIELFTGGSLGLVFNTILKKQHNFFLVSQLRKGTIRWSLEKQNFVNFLALSVVK